MNGVRPGVMVAWGEDSHPTLGVVLDRAPGSATWWVMPEGSKTAVEVQSRAMRSVPNRHRPVGAWRPLGGQPATPVDPLSDAEPGANDVPMFGVA